jgi:hypothetical protein
LGCKAAREYLLPKIEKAEQHIKIALSELVTGAGLSDEPDDPDVLMLLDGAPAETASAGAGASAAAAVVHTGSAAHEVSTRHNEVIDDELEVVGSVGILHTDLPHARFMCLKQPLNEGPTKFCEQCYCFVCDVQAGGCTEWVAHCEATISSPYWLAERRKRKQSHH